MVTVLKARELKILHTRRLVLLIFRVDYQILYDITLEVSTKASPKIADVIIWIDVITNHFDRIIDDPTYPPALRNAVLRGLKLTNKYYGLSDDCVFYRIAIRTLIMLLFPRVKHYLPICFCSASSYTWHWIYGTYEVGTRMDCRSSRHCAQPLGKVVQVRSENTPTERSTRTKPWYTKKGMIRILSPYPQLTMDG